MSMLQPEWWDKPHEEWPEEAKEFYRLLYVGQRRANAHKLGRPCGDMNCAKCHPPKGEPQ